MKNADTSKPRARLAPVPKYISPLAVKRDALKARRKEIHAEVVELDGQGVVDEVGERRQIAIAERTEAFLRSDAYPKLSSMVLTKPSQLSELRIDLEAVDNAITRVDEAIDEEIAEYRRKAVADTAEGLRALVRETALTILHLRRLNRERAAFLDSLPVQPPLPTARVPGARLLGTDQRIGPGWELIEAALRCGAITAKDLADAN